MGIRFTPEEALKSFMDRIHKTDLCWVWIGARTGSGYGAHKFRGVRAHLAHRESYIRFVGEIPKGKLLMHSCDNPACVNPSHLTVGTYKDNIQDAIKKKRFKPYGFIMGSVRTSCKRGHDLTNDANVDKDRAGMKRCKICRKASWIAWHQRQKEANHAQMP